MSPEIQLESSPLPCRPTAALAARLTRVAVEAASQVRVHFGLGPASTISPFDLAAHMGIVVRFDRIRGIEAIYSPEPEPTITLTSQVSLSRRRHRCAQQIGNHVFAHGLRVYRPASEQDDGRDPADVLAERFAIELLMPQSAIDSAFSRRGCEVGLVNPLELYTIAQDLGVEYGRLVEAVAHTLGGPCTDQVRRLRSAGSRLPSVRASLAGFPVEGDLVVADRNWGDRPIDVEVGDTILCPDLAHVSGRCIRFRFRPRPHFVATAPGSGAVELAPGRAPTQVRVDRWGSANPPPHRVRACPA